MATRKGGSGWRAVFISSNFKNSGYPSIPVQSLGSCFQYQHTASPIACPLLVLVFPS